MSKPKCPKHWHKKEWWATCLTCPATVVAADFDATPANPTPQEQERG